MSGRHSAKEDLRTIRLHAERFFLKMNALNIQLTVHLRDLMFCQVNFSLSLNLGREELMGNFGVIIFIIEKMC